MKSIDEIIDACNGEIRIQAVRYGSGFMCLVSVIEQMEGFWEHFEDMIGGDPEWIAARDILESRDMQKANNFAFAYGQTPQIALENAYKIAEQDYIEYCNEKGIK